jgi:hypothetical protein
MRTFALNEWSLIPGPDSNPPDSSLNLRDLIEYPPSTIAEAILALPGTIEENRGDPSWWQWSAKWQCETATVVIGMTLFDTDPVSWGGSPLQGHCSAEQILTLWESLRRTCPGVWMHNDDCEIHTPQSFKDLFIEASNHEGRTSRST